MPKERQPLEPVRKAEELCDRLSVPFADVRTPFREAEPDGTLYVLADYTHLNERGNAVVARVFADMLAPSLLEP